MMRERKARAAGADVRERLADFGPVVQLGYVPRDLDAEINFWLQTMRVGPFFRLEHVRVSQTFAFGQLIESDLTIAFAYWNDTQLELIRQNTTGPSIYSNWIKNGNSGVHHLGINVEDVESARAFALEAHGKVVHEASMPGIAHAILVDFGPQPGHLIEFAHLSPAYRGLFESVRQAAMTWDGTDPVRPLPQLDSIA